MDILILSFMQREDRNGQWLEWLEEINSGESSLDKDYIIQTLTEWYNESEDEKYMNMIELAKCI